MLWARVVSMRCVEVGEGAEGGEDCGVAAFGGAYCPGAAYVVGLGGDGVVFAFAVGGADGVDGRHVEDVEAHGGDLGDAGGYVAEGAVSGWAVGTGGAGEEFVPAGEAGALAVDPERELGGVFGGEGEVGIFCDEGDELGCDGVVVDGEIFVGEGAEVGGGGGEFFCVGALGAGGCGVEMVGADAEGQGDVLRGVWLGRRGVWRGRGSRCRSDRPRLRW